MFAKINDLQLISDTTITGSLGIEAKTDVLKKLHNKEYALFDVPLVGGVVTQARLHAGIVLDVSGNAEIVYSYQVTRGVKWNEKKQDFDEVKDTDHDFELLEVSGEAKLAFLIGLGYHVIGLGDIATMDFSIGAKVKVEKAVSRPLCLDVKGSTVFSIVFELHLFKVWDVTLLNYTREWMPSGWSWHFEKPTSYLHYVRMPTCIWVDRTDDDYVVTFVFGTETETEKQIVTAGECAVEPELEVENFVTESIMDDSWGMGEF